MPKKWIAKITAVKKDQLKTPKIEKDVPLPAQKPSYQQDEPFEPYISEAFKTEETRLGWGVSKYECNVCDGIFTDAASLEHHVNESHQEECKEEPVQPVLTVRQPRKEKVHKCDYPNCGKSFTRKTNLRAHIEKHSGVRVEEKIYKCEYPNCEKAYKTTCERNFHFRSHNAIKPFKCKQTGCTSSFRRIGELNAHMRVHTDERPFRCEEIGCLKTFKTQSQLKQHRSVHSNETPIQCKYPQCGKSFKDKNYLSSHMLVHSVERPFKCGQSQCDKSFKTKSDLNKHKKVHTAVIPFICGHAGCTRAYKYRSDRDKHQRTHSRKIFPCEYDGCTSKFKMKSGLYRHMKNTHTLERKYRCSFENCHATFDKNELLAHHESLHTAEDGAEMSIKQESENDYELESVHQLIQSGNEDTFEFIKVDEMKTEDDNGVQLEWEK